MEKRRLWLHRRRKGGLSLHCDGEPCRAGNIAGAERHVSLCFVLRGSDELPSSARSRRMGPRRGRHRCPARTAPPSVTWRRDALSAAGVNERTTEVWFIGRQREWFVPATPGRVIKIAPIGTIVSEGLSVRLGTSGAALVSKAGIVGMIVEDRGTEVDATPVDVIQRAFLSRNLPWQLVPSRALAPESRSFMVDLTEFRGRQKAYQIRGNMTIQAFLNDLYFEINKTAKMAQFQYGKRWILEDVQSGAPFKDIGGGTDNRPLTELNITPGSTLKARKLK